MTNVLVGDVYLKVIEEVVAASANDFEESGVGQATLGELKQEWQAKLSQRQVAQMPWDPKPEVAPRMTNGATTNGGQYEYAASSGSRVKAEPTEQYQTAATPSYAAMQSHQGGMTRAQELVEQQFGAQAAANIQRQGLALPGQQKGLQLPGQNMTPQQYSQAQHAHMQRQQQALQQQQAQRIKPDPDTPQQRYAQAPPINYTQTDGSDDLAEWQAMIAERRSVSASQIAQNDRFLRDQISALSDHLESGLMMPLDLKRVNAKGRRALRLQPVPETSQSDIAQLDGDVDDKSALKLEEEDEDAINSDLDDPDDDQNPIGDDEDELGDTILCTYDKVQRVKNKWKCTLKDGVLNTGGKEWLFHKGQGEFEW